MSGGNRFGVFLDDGSSSSDDEEVKKIAKVEKVSDQTDEVINVGNDIDGNGDGDSDEAGYSNDFDPHQPSRPQHSRQAGGLVMMRTDAFEAASALHDPDRADVDALGFTAKG